MRSYGPLSVHERTESIGSLGFLPFLYHSDVNNCLNGGVTAWEENRIIPQRNHSYRYLRLALSESPETILTFPESLHFSISNPFLKYLLLITDPTVSQTPIPQASLSLSSCLPTSSTQYHLFISLLSQLTDSRGILQFITKRIPFQ